MWYSSKSYKCNKNIIYLKRLVCQRNKNLTLNLTDVIIDKNYTCKIWNMKDFYKMGRVVVVTFDENEEEKAIFRAYTLRGRVFVPYPSVLHIVPLRCYFLIFIISSSTASVYFACAISLFLKERNKEPPILFYKVFNFLQIGIAVFCSKLIHRLQFVGIFLNSPDFNRAWRTNHHSFSTGFPFYKNLSYSKSYKCNFYLLLHL